MIKKIIIFTLCLGILLVADMASASSGLGSAGTELNNAAGKTSLSGDFGSTITTVVSAILAIVGTIFLIMMVYAGVLWMTAAGKSDQAERARKIVTESVIGLVITLSSYAITNFVGTKLGSGSSASGGSSTTCASLGGTCKTTCADDDKPNTSAGDCTANKQVCCVSILHCTGKGKDLPECKN